MSEQLKFPLVFIQCLKLLEECAQNDILSYDPERKGHILVYCNASDEYPEGWYSENIYEVAQDLMRDIDGQKLLVEELQKKNINTDSISKVLSLLSIGI